MIIERCTIDGCNLFTIGTRCVQHDLPVTRTFVRGRPFQRTADGLTETPRTAGSNAVLVLPRRANVLARS